METLMTPKIKSAPKKEPAQKREVAHKRGHSARKDTQHKSRLHEAFQEEIANTYFRVSSAPKKAHKKGRVPPAAWIVAGIALLIVLGMFFSKSNFDIKVKLVNDTPYVTRDGSIVPIRGMEFLVKGGDPDKVFVSRAYFLGDARASSTTSDSVIDLVNSRGQGWASYVVELNQPIDLTKFDIRYLAKGSGGGEKVYPIIFDTQNRSYRIVDPSATTLMGDWQVYVLNFSPVKGNIDLKKISKLKFEFGSETAGNGPASSMSMKDISILKTRRIKWL